jgi:hypothetical protein
MWITEAAAYFNFNAGKASTFMCKQLSVKQPRSLFVRLISHQPTVLFSQNKPATSNQPTVLFSQNKSASVISHQPNEQADSSSVFGAAVTRIKLHREDGVN